MATRDYLALGATFGTIRVEPGYLEFVGRAAESLSRTSVGNPVTRVTDSPHRYRKSPYFCTAQ